MRKFENYKLLSHFCILLLTLTTLTSCKKETVQLDDKFVELYSELRLATISNQYQKERASKIRKIILEKYGWTQAKYSDNLEMLKQNPNLWHNFQDSVVSYIDEMEHEHKKSK